MNAMQVSPAHFAMGNATPGLNLSNEALAAIAQRGGADLAQTHARLAAWLQNADPNVAAMNQERRILHERYREMEEYLVCFSDIVLGN